MATAYATCQGCDWEVREQLQLGQVPAELVAGQADEHEQATGHKVVKGWYEPGAGPFRRPGSE